MDKKTRPSGRVFHLERSSGTFFVEAMRIPPLLPLEGEGLEE
jgi:hypothetical protein